MPSSHSSISPLFKASDMLISNTAIANVMMSTNCVTFTSFVWYFLEIAVATPLMLAPAIEMAANGMLTGKPMKVLRVTTFDIQWPCLSCSSKCSAIPVDLISWSTWSISSCTFPLVLTTLVAYFGLHLGDRTEVPKEPRVPLGDLDIHYNSLSF